MDWPWSKTRTVWCSDSDDDFRILFRDPSKAFPLELRNLYSDVSGEVGAMRQIRVTGSATFQSTVETLLCQIDEANRSMQSQFEAIYIGYMNNPCANDRWYNREIKKIIERETRMREQLIALRLSIARGNGNGNSEETASEALRDLNPTSNVLSEKELKQTMEDSEEWKIKT